MIRYKQADSDKELQQILQLQGRNLPENLTLSERKEKGFVTVKHDLDLLKRMNEACPHTLAKDHENVIGYALSMHPKLAGEIAILKPMFDEIKKVLPKNDDYLVMGQICTAKAYRGQGVFRNLYQHMKDFMNPTFITIVTQVDTSNQRSLEAHKTIGFKEVKRYTSDDREWSLIVLK